MEAILTFLLIAVIVWASGTYIFTNLDDRMAELCKRTFARGEWRRITITEQRQQRLRELV